MKPVHSWWTPRRVVMTLTWYREIAETLEAGTFNPGECHPGAVEWEPGSAIEKLTLRKADIDQALRRIDRRCANAVRVYFIEENETHHGVARKLRVSVSLARRLVSLGVAYLAMLLCDRITAGNEAMQLLKSVRQNKSKVNQAKTLPVLPYKGVYELE